MLTTGILIRRHIRPAAGYEGKNLVALGASIRFRLMLTLVACVKEGVIETGIDDIIVSWAMRAYPGIGKLYGHTAMRAEKMLFFIHHSYTIPYKEYRTSDSDQTIPGENRDGEKP